MKSTSYLLVLAAVSAFSVLGCAEDPNDLTGGRGRGSNGGGADDESTDGVAAALQCTEGPIGRSYTLFDGSKMEEKRQNENVGVNRARVKPFAAMEKEFERVLGVVPPSLKGAAGSFDMPAARWYGEAEYSAVSLHAMAEIAFEGCLAYTKTSPAFAAAPTDESARTECSKLMRKAWSRSPSPEEIAGCSELATKTLADEKDVGRRWAYACSSVLSASQFLTF